LALSLRGSLLPAKPEERRLTVAFFINGLGTGAYAPIALIFLVRVAHWSSARAGFAMSAGGLIALFTSLITGWAGDRLNPRSLAAALFVCQGLSMCALCTLGTVRSYPLLIFILAVSAGASNGSRPVWGVIVSEIGGDNRVRLRAQLRAQSNIAMAAGSVLAGVGLEVGAGSYKLLVLANAVSFFAAAVLLPRVHRVIPVPGRRVAISLAALRNRRFVGASSLNVVMTWQYSVMTIALPAWIVLRTSMPHWVAGGALALNCVLVVVLQVPASRRVQNLPQAAVATRLAGGMFLLACTGFALVAQIPAATAILLIAGATVMQTIGEVFHASAAFEIPYAFAPQSAVGEYQGVFEGASSASVVSAPTVLTLLCVAWGIPGWLALGGLFLGVGCGMHQLLRAGSRDRDPVRDLAGAAANDG
jgi:MFS family permease